MFMQKLNKVLLNNPSIFSPSELRLAVKAEKQNINSQIFNCYVLERNNLHTTLDQFKKNKNIDRVQLIYRDNFADWLVADICLLDNRFSIVFLPLTDDLAVLRDSFDMIYKYFPDVQINFLPVVAKKEENSAILSFEYARRLAKIPVKELHNLAVEKDKREVENFFSDSYEEFNFIGDEDYWEDIIKKINFISLKNSSDLLFKLLQPIDIEEIGLLIKNSSEQQYEIEAKELSDNQQQASISSLKNVSYFKFAKPMDTVDFATHDLDQEPIEDSRVCFPCRIL